MRRVGPLTLAVLAMLVIGAGTAQAAGHLNAYSIQGQFFCVSCHEPLNQVHSPEAQNEKATLSQLVAKGLDLKQIKADMVAYYGQDVLGEPPARGFNLLLYVLPPLVVVVGLVLFAVNLPRWRARARAQARANSPGPGGTITLDPADAQRLDDELEDFDA